MARGMVTELDINREALATIALSHRWRGDIHEEVWLDTLVPPQANPVDWRLRPLSWCRSFVLYCLRARYRADHGVEPPSDWIWLPGLGFEGPHGLRVKRIPDVGHEAYRRHGQHGAIVTRVHGDGTIDTVDGNSFDGRNYGVVAHHERTPIAQWDAFYDLSPMLE